MENQKYVVTYHPSACFRDPYKRALIRRDLKLYLNPPNLKPVNYKVVEGLRGISSSKVVIDYETEGLLGNIKCVGVMGDTNNCYVVKGAFDPKVLEGKEVWAHGGIYEWQVTYKNWGIDLPVNDTMVLLGLEMETQGAYPLKGYARYNGYGDYGINVEDINAYPEEVLHKYNATDCYVTWDILKNPRYNKWVGTPIERMEQELIRVLARMRHNGMLFSRDQIIELGSVMENTAKEKELAIYRNYNIPSDTNLRSNIQVGDIIYKKFGLYHRERPSVKESVLVDLSRENPFCSELRSWRKAVNFTSKFIRPYLDALDPEGYVYPSPLIHGTDTGRLAIISPAIHQLPPDMWDCLISRFPKGKLITFDWKTIEVVVAAYLNRDKNLMRALRDGRDLHTFTASQVFGKKEESITVTERRTAKTITFLLIYLGSAGRLATELHIGMSEATTLRTKWLDTFPGVELWAEEIFERVKDTLTLYSIFGRRRRFPQMEDYAALKGWRGSMGSHILKQAVNFPVQSAAADITYLAMIELNRFLLTKKMDSIIINSRHDSVTMDCPMEEITVIINKIKSLPEFVISEMKRRFGCSFDLPLKLEVK